MLGGGQCAGVNGGEVFIVRRVRANVRGCICNGLREDCVLITHMYSNNYK